MLNEYYLLRRNEEVIEKQESYPVAAFALWQQIYEEYKRKGTIS